ncbi:MAG TPA: hypothetical protein VM689_04970 [Aliidongia sp.]|nr:hypothetical protein [Aliidongia sp.]
MRLALALAGLLLAFSRPAGAADSLGVSDEHLMTVKGRIVDLACAIAHDCRPHCAEGHRPLGLEADDGKLYVAAKSNTIFAGLNHDLAAYCGKEITADGLTTGNYGSTLLMIQRFKPGDDADWIETDKFGRDWAERHHADPAGKETEEWYRHDDDVLRTVDRHGKTGLEK